MPIGTPPEVVSREEWLAARQELLAEEKELTRARDRVNAARRRLPMVRVDEPYTFDGPDGQVGLPDLFESRPQLVMHHFTWLFDLDADGHEIPRDDTCSSCSSAANCIPERLTQLHVRNTTLVAVSRAPYDKIAASRERMGWTFPWYSSAGFGRGIDLLGAPPGLLGHYLDLTALGRQEEWEEPQGRATPLGLEAGGPNLRLPDDYGDV